MVPKLGKQMDGAYKGQYIAGNANNGKGHNGKNVDIAKHRYLLAQGTGQVKLLAAVVNYMVAPKVVYLMF
jgi:hypothetical protein